MINMAAVRQQDYASKGSTAVLKNVYVSFHVDGNSFHKLYHFDVTFMSISSCSRLAK